MDDQRYREIAEQHATRLEEQAADLLTLANETRRDAGLIDDGDG